MFCDSKGSSAGLPRLPVPPPTRTGEAMVWPPWMSV